jgi:hypothetical protein
VDGELCLTSMGRIRYITGRNLEHAGLGAIGIEDGPDAEALQERAPGRCPRPTPRSRCLQTPDAGLAKHQPVEGDKTGSRSGVPNRETWLQ